MVPLPRVALSHLRDVLPSLLAAENDLATQGLALRNDLAWVVGPTSWRGLLRRRALESLQGLHYLLLGVELVDRFEHGGHPLPVPRQHLKRIHEVVPLPVTEHRELENVLIVSYVAKLPGVLLKLEPFQELGDHGLLHRKQLFGV